MAFDYAPIRQLSIDLIAEFGKNFTLRRFGTSAYDTSTGQVNRTIDDETFVGVALDPTNRRLDRTTTTSQSMFRILAQFDTPPTADDKIIISQREYNILNVKNVQPACTAVLTELTVSL